MPVIRSSELRKRRERAGLKKTELARKCRISARYVAELEKGNYPPSIEVLYRLAAALDCDIADLTPEQVAA